MELVAAHCVPSTRSRGRSQRQALALAAISAGFLMITLDATIVNVALRAIGADLGGAPSTAQWVVDGYTVAFASLLPLAGSLADRELAVGTGAAVVCPEYDRSPEAHYPVAIEQNYAAAQWFLNSGAANGLDAARFAVAGDSAATWPPR